MIDIKLTETDSFGRRRLEHCHTKINSMNLATCRVCLGKSRGMLNIFKSKLESGMTIADMLWEATGYPNIPGDSYPKTICATCLQDGQNAFDIKQTYERSHQFFCDFQKILIGKEDLSELKVMSVKDERLSPP
ncbi:uncharacterized protein LOC110182663 [Drosophila serrata]|uniref:uncharacterized protein LOC110182663 n=1 Tax=Drosophila serrata TaxID=7274 RepID=UPI000A1D1694|nr:uncharacterized protein LOC110182663 [Drosophila serrata]